MSNQDHLLYFYMGSHLQHVMKSLGSTTFIRNGSVVLAESLYETSRAATTLVGSDMANSPISGNVRGTPVQQVFTPYGYNRQAVPPLTSTGFTGQPRTSAEPMYLMGNGYRVYITILMRLCSPDALSPLAAGGINAYAYCGNDPINYSDQSGRTRTKNINARRLRARLRKIERKPNKEYDEQFALADAVMASNPPPLTGGVRPEEVPDLSVEEVKFVFNPPITPTSHFHIRRIPSQPFTHIDVDAMRKWYENTTADITPDQFKTWIAARVLDLKPQTLLRAEGFSETRAQIMHTNLSKRVSKFRGTQ